MYLHLMIAILMGFTSHTHTSANNDGTTITTSCDDPNCSGGEDTGEDTGGETGDNPIKPPKP